MLTDTANWEYRLGDTLVDLFLNKLFSIHSVLYMPTERVLRPCLIPLQGHGLSMYVGMKLYGARRSHARNGTNLPDRTKRYASDLMLILLVRSSLPLPLASRLSLNHRLKIPWKESPSFPFSLYLSNNGQRLAAAARHQCASIPSWEKARCGGRRSLGGEDDRRGLKLEA